MFLRLLACGELLWSDLVLAVVGIEETTNSAALPAGVGHKEGVTSGTLTQAGPFWTIDMLIYTSLKWIFSKIHMHIFPVHRPYPLSPVAGFHTSRHHEHKHFNARYLLLLSFRIQNKNLTLRNYKLINAKDIESISNHLTFFDITKIISDNFKRISFYHEGFL